MDTFGEAQQLYDEALALVAERSDYNSAESILRKCLELDPNHAKAYAKMGWWAYRKGVTKEESLRLLNKAIELDSSLADAHMYLGMVLGSLGRHDDAQAHFESSITYGDDPCQSRASYAKYLAENGQYSRAESLFKEALTYDNNSVFVLREYARLLSCLDHLREAARNFQRALEIDPEDALTLYRYGEYLNQLEGFQDEALTYLRRALEINPKLEAARKEIESTLDKKEPTAQ